MAPSLFLPLSEHRKIFDVNFFGHLRVTQVFFPLLKKCKGRITFTASFAGQVVPHMCGVYGASKHAVEALADCLQTEIADFGHSVSVVEPGATLTDMSMKSYIVTRRAFTACESQPLQDGTTVMEMYRTEREKYERAPSGKPPSTFIYAPPEKVANAVVHALLDPYPNARYQVGNDTPALLALKRWAPSKYLDVVTALMKAS